MIKKFPKYIIMLYNKVLLCSKSYLQDLKLIYTVFILKLDLIIKLFLACLVFILGMSNLHGGGSGVNGQTIFTLSTKKTMFPLTH